MVKKTIEETYQKLTQREHVLLRSGMYIGSVKKQMEELWVPDPETYMMKKKIVEYSPGFMKIFDEVLTNATDHSFRHPEVTQIKINYSQETGEISVYNNGPGIPVVEHQEHKMYVPELIFGHLLSGSNYDDSDSRTGSGTNGVGSKCNSLDTKILLFNGEIKLAKDIKIGDILIGDDGNKRTVLSTIFGKGKMYEVSQNRGESYKVNDEHVLTLHMPDHKVIFWNNNGWKILWWDNEHKKINSKHFKAIDNKIKCNECEIELHSNLNRHYKRRHPNKTLPVKQRKIPNNKPDMNNEKILKTYNEINKFSKNIQDNNVFDISIKDYLNLSKTTQSRLAGVRGEYVNWEYQNVELDPYVLGLWLGDGMKSGYSYACDGENDNEIIEYLTQWGLKNDANLKQSNTNKYKYDFSSIDNYGKKGYAPLKKILDKYNLIKNKHIPKEYLINSREIRLKVLAGFIDTDGTLSRDGTRIRISQSWKHEQLILDVLYLARSLGFCCSMTSGMAKYKLKNGEKKESKVYKVNISGNIQDIPTILLRKKCNNTKKQNTDKSTGQITIKEIKETDYIGIHINGNERFLINDFTVTHNCTNIYSKKFVVETVDSNTGKKFIQEHSLNMTVKSKAKITSNSKSSYTKITFIPDYQRFDMEGLEDDTCLLINKRAIDCIACTASTVKIYLNGDLLKGKGMTDYTKYYFDEAKVYNESFSERVKNKKGEFVEYIWEYTIVPSEHYEQVSFVNGNATLQGGKHVDYIMYQIINKLKTMLETKKKLKELKPNFIKDKLFLFLRATVANPIFNSQTKEQLTTASKDFGCVVQVSDKFIERLYKSSITEEIVEFCKAKEIATLSKHSVSGDTPLLLKDKNDKIIIKTIEKITEIFAETENNNDYGKSDYKVWTEEGWTEIIHIMRHKSCKQMYRILTHTGFVDVTEDHSLLTDKIEEISPKNCKIGDNLLHSFPEFIDNAFELNLNYKDMKSIELHNYAKYLKIPYYRGTKDKLISLIENKHIEYNKLLKINLNYDNSIDIDESWVMGLFWADGTAGIYCDSKGFDIFNFAIHNVNKEFLIKAQKILEEKYNEKTTIYKLERDITRQIKYQLQFNGYSKIKYIVSKYIDLFYYGKNDKTKYGNKYGNKYVPMEILNSKRNIRENFLKGVYCGDGRSHNIDTKGVKEISIDSKISSQGIYYLAKSLGYFVSIQCREDKPNIFTLILGKYYYNIHPDKIKKIIKLGCTNEYVYDLETKNHHFQAGIGRMIVHNTDGKKTNKIYIPKLEDALWAGTNKSNECTLILTEGDSAATFAKWGRAVVGPEKFGVFPLKGKCVQNLTKIPLFNGEIKLAKDIQIGDTLIGDDGNKRTVLTLYKGNGKMYEVFQDRGESYKVNDEHILTLCIPEHKSIYWYDEHSSWRTIYWDKTIKNIKVKEIQTSIKIKCNECGIMMNNQSLKRHYLRRHKNVKFQKSKTIIDMNDLKVIEARKKLEEFLLNIDDNNIIDICIQDYFKVTKSHQRKLKGIRGECVKWDHQDVLLDPYVLGLWLGDGCKSGYSYACDGENDYHLIDYLKEWGKNNDANLKKINKYCYNFSSINNFGEAGYAPLKKILEKYNVIKNKHIPKEYLVNSKEIRLKVLAGIIDTDGTVYDDGTIEISQSVQVHQQLTDNIVYLARSLGFYTHLKKKVTNYKYKTGEKAEAYIIKISGDTEEIPTILPRKKSISTTQYNMRNSTGTIKIKEIDNCNYVGIGIDCNSRFVINDFTVTHNCLNVRQATVQQLIGNEEINNLKQIIGLKQDQVYKNTNDLRYSKVMILTDADLDGYHIRGLLINFFHAQWPSLVKLNFIQTLKTPIVKAIKGKKVLEFYTEQDYHIWKQTVNPSTFNIKYFKGLGTSKKDDAKDTFNRIDTLIVDYYYKDKLCDESILLAFDKDKNQNKPSKKKTETESENGSEIVEEFVKCSDRRKEWLSKYDRDSYVEMKESRVSYQDMINKELIHFSIYDNSRSIPSLCDGLKPSQRKILYYMLKKNITNPIKVAQLSGYVSAECGYHHGEASLQGAIIGMAQDFVGSNNINLLYPDGSFGSRFMNGKDAASARYIFTHLTNTTQLIFNSNDTPLLKMCDDDGSVIEPEWYLPIIPMVLVNGCEGIGTGYSTFIPPFNPKDIIENLLRVLNDDLDPLPMKPWYRGFNGTIEEKESESGNYISKGKWQKMSDTQLKITELPVGMGITTYKEYLESLIENSSSMKRGEKKATKNKVRKVVLRDVQNKTKDENDAICFIVEFKDANNLADLIKNETLEKELKLTKSFSTNNMYLFNQNMILTKYQTANDILLDFYDLRLDYYQLRKEYLEKKLKEELVILEAKKRFIQEYIDQELDINRKSKDIIVDLLKKKKYPLHQDTYDYLLTLPVYSFTLERINKLSEECKKKKDELRFIQSKSNSDLWCIDLKELQSKLI